MTRDFYNYFVSLVEDDSILQTRDGTGQDFFDPTGKFQNHRRLTGFFTESFMYLMKNFQKGGMGKELKFVTLDGGLRKKTTQFSDFFWLSFGLNDLL